MSRSLPAVAAAVAAAIGLAACGGSSGASGDGPAPASIKASIERAADVRLTDADLPAEATEEGLKASFSNAATAAADRQLVFLFVMDDADAADEVREQAEASMPKPSKVIANDNVLVVYASTGADHAAQVQDAVDAL